MRELVLNKEQQLVVDTLDQNLLLVASAGTGKTNTLACRVAHILDTQTEPMPHVLCLTYTNKACREMQERIHQRVKAAAGAVEVFTFHSFCFSVLKSESRLRGGIPQDMTIFDEEDAALVVVDAMRTLDVESLFSHRKNPAQDILLWIEKMKHKRVTYGIDTGIREETLRETLAQWQRREPEEYRAFCQRARGVYEEESSALIALMVEYEVQLQQQQAYDFTDLIVEVRRLFQDPAVRERWNGKYQYICIDEMQDTSRLEYEVVETLFPGNRVLLCGDYFQTIYEWRGSEPWEIRADFIKKYTPKLVTFYQNYRSNATLFSVGFSVLQYFFPELVAKIYDQEPYAHQQTEGAPVRCLAADTRDAQAQRIFSYIQRLPNDGSTIAILCRANQETQDLSQSFARFNRRVKPEERKEFILVDTYKFFRRAEIKDVMAFLKLIVNPRDTMSAERIVKAYVPGVGDKRLQELRSEEAKLAGIGVTDFFHLKLFEEEPYAALERGWQDGKVIVYDVEATGTNEFGKDEIIQIAAIRIDENGDEIDRFERFIRPTIPVGTSEEVHHFSDAYLEDVGEDAKTVLQDFLEYTEGGVIVGHNVQFDISILRQELTKYGLAMPQFAAVYDTLDIFRRFYPRLPNYKLATLSTTFPGVHPPTHNAWDDIVATADLLVMAFKDKIVPSRDQRLAYIRKYRAYFSEIAAQMDSLRQQVKTERPTTLLAYIMNQLGVRDKIKNRFEGSEAAARLERLRDLYRIFKELEDEWDRCDLPVTGLSVLQRIIRDAALCAGEGDPSLKNKSKIPIITVHQSKGCEFDHVIIADCSQGVFPSKWATEKTMSEEQRLFYVAITRAKQDLVITYRTDKASPFLAAIPLPLKQIG